MAFVVAVVLVDRSTQGGHYEVFAAIHPLGTIKASQIVVLNEDM